LLLHVTDVSEDNYQERIKAVENVLAEIEVAHIPCLKVYNKIDRLGSNLADLEQRVDQSQVPGVLVSALTGQGIDKLLAQIAARLENSVLHATFKLPYAKASLLPLLHEKGKVLKEDFTDEGIQVEAEIPRSFAQQNQEFITHIFKS
jgi:GTP-binding protein HflX